MATLLGMISLLAVPASAQAVDICVNRTDASCAQEDRYPDIQSAVSDVNDETARPRLLIGEGDYVVPSIVTFTRTVDVVGAGRTKTFVTGPNGNYTFNFNAAGSTMTDTSLKLVGTGGSFGVLMTGSSVERSDVTSKMPASTNPHYAFIVAGTDSVIKDVTITLPNQGTSVGIYNLGATTTIENVRSTAQIAVYNVSGFTTVRQSDLRGPYGARSDNGTLKVSNTRIRIDETPVTDEAALFALAGDGDKALVDADHVTIVGAPQVAGNVGAAAHAQYTGSCLASDNQTGSATVRLTNSIIDDIPNRFHMQGCQAPPDCSPDPAVSPGVRSANIRMDTVRYQAFGARSNSGGCNQFLNGSFGAPGFISDADQRLRGSSGAVDSGKPGVLAPGEGDKDLLGKPRIVDGDGNGSAVRDLGAYEYQRQAPTVTAAVTPASGPPGTTFRFTSTGSDADGEDVSFVWTFDDGVAVQGQNVEKSWSSLGAHSATVQVKDDGGVVTTRTADVTVVDPPKPVVTVVPTPVPDTTAPVITLTGGTFTVSAKRVVKLKLSCNETATGVLSAKSARKVKLKRRAKAKILSLGSKAYSCAPGAPVTVSLKLSAAAFKYLKKVKRLKVALAATGKDAAGNAGTATGKATFKAPRKRR